MKDYFVILVTQNGYTPLVDKNSKMLFFKTQLEAISKAESSFFGKQFGYEVFCIGEGR